MLTADCGWILGLREGGLTDISAQQKNITNVKDPCGKEYIRLGLLGRVLQALHECQRSHKVLNLHGDRGSGRSTVVSQLIQHLLRKRMKFREGVFRLSGQKVVSKRRGYLTDYIEKKMDMDLWALRRSNNPDRLLIIDDYQYLKDKLERDINFNSVIEAFGLNGFTLVLVTEDALSSRDLFSGSQAMRDRETVNVGCPSLDPRADFPLIY